MARRIIRVKLSSILSKSFGCGIRPGCSRDIFRRPIFTNIIRISVIKTQNQSVYIWVYVTFELTRSCQSKSSSLLENIPVQTPFILFVDFLNFIGLIMVGIQTLIRTAQLTEILNRRSSFICRIRFHMQININFVKVMRNKLRVMNQIDISVNVRLSWHTTKGSGPNQTLALLIPHIIMLNIAPYNYAN